jgi:hypothetical protein
MTNRIEIYDATRTVDGKKMKGFRVKTVASNNEILQTSEVLNTASSVKKHICAMCEAWRSFYAPSVYDMTKDKKMKGTSFDVSVEVPISKLKIQEAV